MTKMDQTILLGRKAGNIRDLLDGIRSVPDASIYFHTHKFLQQHHFLSPEPPNDFSYWITNVLNEVTLGERISSVDTIQFHCITDLRKQFVQIIEDFLTTINRVINAPLGQEFYFMASKTFVLVTLHVASSLQEFVQHLQQVSIYSIYYHMFDAHLRLEQEENDFSEWFRQMGHMELADAVRHIDPYTQTLEGLRKKILQMVKKHGQD